ncbi:MAG: DUF2971 domain-containing protein [Chloroflexota bacterium]
MPLDDIGWSLLQLLSKVSSKMFLEFRKIVEENTPDPQTVYHYTNNTGLRGIIENNTLWATHLSFVNDSREIDYGLSLFKKKIEELEKQLQADEKSLAILKNLITLPISATTVDTYACSFSRNGDQLSQWRGYTPNTIGYSIGFNDLLLSTGSEFTWSMLPVLYSADKHEKFASTVINSYLDVYWANQEKFSSPENETLFVQNLLSQAEFWSVVLKHEGFSEEQEVRLAFKAFEGTKIKFRERNGVIVPYVEFKMFDPSPRLPLKEVIIGPTDHYERAKAGLRLLLDKNGFDSVTIRQSDIPYRAQ